jgi:hypothetical protein
MLLPIRSLCPSLFTSPTHPFPVSLGTGGLFVRVNLLIRRTKTGLGTLFELWAPLGQMRPWWRKLPTVCPGPFFSILTPEHPDRRRQGEEGTDSGVCCSLSFSRAQENSAHQR